jgi:sugar phosphate isomerase/epimerase
LPELLEIAEAASAVISGMEIREEDEAEFYDAGWRVSADEMQKRMDRLNVAVSIYQTMAIQHSSEEDSKSISCDHPRDRKS